MFPMFVLLITISLFCAEILRELPGWEAIPKADINTTHICQSIKNYTSQCLTNYLKRIAGKSGTKKKETSGQGGGSKKRNLRKLSSSSSEEEKKKNSSDEKDPIIESTRVKKSDSKSLHSNMRERSFSSSSGDEFSDTN